MKKISRKKLAKNIEIKKKIGGMNIEDKRVDI
jgi:hypothetical protein